MKSPKIRQVAFKLKCNIFILPLSKNLFQFSWVVV